MNVCSQNQMHAKRPAPAQIPFVVLLFLSLALCGRGTNLFAQNATTWWKGNLHTHSLWSDGDDYPEMIAAWYRDQGYNFLVFTEHNVMLEGERWFSTTPQRGGGVALQKYLTRYGTNWVVQRTQDGNPQVRLKTLEEFRALFEESGRFLLMPGQEITDRFLTAPIHINAINLHSLVEPRGGTGIVEVLQQNVNAVLEQREKTGQPMFPHINHPNFVWAITAEELMQIRGEKFFEVYNGHPSVHNDGDATRAGMDRVWDITLTWRLAFLGLEPMWGLATDDSHHYHEQRVGFSNAGRGWVMVRAPELTDTAIIRALEAGDFYSTSGVILREMQITPDRYHIEIEPEEGVEYLVEFIGTRRGFDSSNTPATTPDGNRQRITHTYSDEVGQVLHSVRGPVAEYRPKGDEWYVRARVTSTKLMANPYREGEFERAWTQPLVVSAKADASQTQTSPAHRMLEQDRPRIIAHRGYSGVAPENTSIAFRRAIEARADLVELDYHHSKDGIPVVLHDFTLDRTTDAIARHGGKDLKIADWNFNDLQALETGRWFQPPHPGQTLLTLEAAVDQIQAGSLTLIERKAGDAATTESLLRRRNWINQVIVQSFDWSYIKDLHDRLPEQVLGALGPPSQVDGRRLSDEEKVLNEDWLKKVATTGARLVVWNSSVTPASVELAHRLGLRVWIYTVNEEVAARNLLQMGVDGIITDHPALLWHVLATPASSPSPE